MSTPSKKFIKIAEVYKIFSNPLYDFSNKALKEMYDYESKGKGGIEIGLFTSKINGYMYGKKMLNITVSMWKEDIKLGLLTKKELLEDNKFPHWWLKRIGI